jgi:hypothetical protein
MKKITNIIFLVLSAYQVANADCTDVIKLSKTTTEVVQDKKSFEDNASAFCKEYKSSSSSAKSANYGLSYKFLAASVGSSNASETDIASKFCSSDSSENRRSDAYRQYVESISDKAYAAYESCERMKNDEITFNLNSLLKKELTILVSSSRKAEIEFDTNGGVKCNWRNGNARENVLSLQGSSALLKCSREKTIEESSITILETSGSKGNSLTIPWAALDNNGLPIDHLKLLNEKFGNAIANLEKASKQFNGAVIAFNAEKCPDGWREYEPAYGRFIRGLDKSGTSIDPDKRTLGSPQGDALQSHKHVAEGNWFITDDRGTINRGGEIGSRAKEKVGIPISDGVNGEPRLANETRPKNVALLYCEKK